MRISKSTGGSSCVTKCCWKSGSLISLTEISLFLLFQRVVGSLEQYPNNHRNSPQYLKSVRYYFSVKFSAFAIFSCNFSLKRETSPIIFRRILFLCNFFNFSIKCLHKSVINALTSCSGRFQFSLLNAYNVKI